MSGCRRYARGGSYWLWLWAMTVFWQSVLGHCDGCEEAVWRDRLLDKHQIRPSSSDSDSGSPMRRITPKSVFVAPGFSGCSDGYRQDGLGRCVKLVKVNQAAQLDFILQKLNSKFARPSDKNGLNAEKHDSGPFRVSIPLGSGKEDERPQTTASVVTTTSTGIETVPPVTLSRQPDRPTPSSKPFVIIVADSPTTEEATTTATTPTEMADNDFYTTTTEPATTTFPLESTIGYYSVANTETAATAATTYITRPSQDDDDEWIRVDEASTWRPTDSVVEPAVEEVRQETKDVEGVLEDPFQAFSSDCDHPPISPRQQGGAGCHPKRVTSPFASQPVRFPADGVTAPPESHAETSYVRFPDRPAVQPSRWPLTHVNLNKPFTGDDVALSTSSVASWYSSPSSWFPFLPQSQRHWVERYNNNNNNNDRHHLDYRESESSGYRKPYHRYQRRPSSTSSHVLPAWFDKHIVAWPSQTAQHT